MLIRLAVSAAAQLQIILNNNMAEGV